MIKNVRKEKIAKIALRSLSVFIICFGLLLSAELTLSASVEIKFPHTTSEDTRIGQGANLFKKLVEERLAGKVIVKVYPASQFGNVTQIIEALQKGVVQIAVLPIRSFTMFKNEFLVFDLPFLFEDLGAVSRFQNSPDGEKLLAAMEKQGLKGLAFWHYGMNQLSANKPIRIPYDANGLALWMPTSKVLAVESEVLKLKAIQLPFGEVYHALKSGLLNGFESTWSSIYRFKLYEVSKYVSATDHRYTGFILVANNNFWNNLPSDLQREINIIVPELTKKVNKLVVEDSYQAAQEINRIEKVIILTYKEREQWNRTMKPVWGKFENEIGKNIIEAAFKAGTGGGGEPCPIGTCRCKDRTCHKDCCD